MNGPVRFHPLLLALLLCATAGVATGEDHHGGYPRPQFFEIRTINQANLERLKIGQSRNEVIAVMGAEGDIQTYKGNEKLRVVRNPYRGEKLLVDGVRYEVLYYYTNLNTPDDVITDDELTPVVLRADVLVGWGWDIYRKHVGNPQSPAPERKAEGNSADSRVGGRAGV